MIAKYGRYPSIELELVSVRHGMDSVEFEIDRWACCVNGCDNVDACFDDGTDLF